MMTREEVRFVLPPNETPWALGSKLCPGFFPDLDSGTRQVSVKLQAGHWGMYEKWRCDSRFFFGGPKYIL